MVSPERTSDSKCPPFISPQLAKAVSNPQRARILMELNRRQMSPSQYAREFDHSVNDIARKFRELKGYKCIEVVEERSGGSRRGGVEHIYRATRRAMFDDSVWKGLPMSVRNDVTGTVFQAYIERVAQAFEAGTIDERDDRHFTWTAVVYDQQAWDELIEMVNALFERSLELQVEAALRMAESGEKPIPATVGLACFESPPTPQPQPEPEPSN